MNGPVAASYLYGVVLVQDTATGWEGLPEDVTFVPYQQIAGVTRPAPQRLSRGLRPQLLGYAELLDRVARTAPVLPVQFGTAVSSAAALVDEILAPGHDSFVAALTALAPYTQFTVRARYRDDAVIQEVLAEQPATADLHRRVQQRERGGAYRGGDQSGRMLLGERVARAVSSKRTADTDLMIASLRPHTVAVSVTPARSVESDRIVDLAGLVTRAGSDGFESAVEQLGRHWAQRAKIRLLGPMAPYDFAAAAVDGELTIAGAAPQGATAWAS